MGGLHQSPALLLTPHDGSVPPLHGLQLLPLRRRQLAQGSPAGAGAAAAAPRICCHGLQLLPDVRQAGRCHLSTTGGAGQHIGALRGPILGLRMVSRAAAADAHGLLPNAFFLKLQRRHRFVLAPQLPLPLRQPPLLPVPPGAKARCVVAVVAGQPHNLQGTPTAISTAAAADSTDAGSAAWGGADARISCQRLEADCACAKGLVGGTEQLDG
jgi:hypothetical protein